jgi:protein-S-isoprenylcysteine O-methyltransferase Ste14
MRVVDLVIVVVWVAFWTCWLIAARGVKSGKSGGWNRLIELRVALGVVVVFLVRAVGLRGHSGVHSATTGPVLGGVGLALFLLGLIVAAVLAGFFIYSAIREEAYLTEQFKDTYRACKHSTKMLIPFVL